MEDINAYIGKKLTERREKLGITIVDAAKEVGLTRFALMNIEKGRKGTRPIVLWKLSIAYDCQVGYFFPKKEK